MSYIKEHQAIKRGGAADLCRISPFQANRLLKKLTRAGIIIAKGKGKGMFYECQVSGLQCQVSGLQGCKMVSF
jgi:ATP-dependent DNA helicase RecG